MNAVVAAEIHLPAVASARGIAETTWRTLSNVLYPGAAPESVGMVWDYCQARKLDPLKKPVHIVPMEVKNAITGRYEWRDCVVPGIYEYRTTAQRTGEYLGHSKPAYGPKVDFNGVAAPEFCDFTVFRWNPGAQQRVEFPITVYFGEVVATKDGKPNARWRKAPIQMLTKCAEAAALRAAFPEELGGEPTAEEVEDNRIVAEVVTAAPVAAQVKPDDPKPEGYDSWLADLEAVADEGTARLSATWKASHNDFRTYLTRNQMAVWERLKAKAEEVIPV
jgi:phage recombination protein Bet